MEYAKIIAITGMPGLYEMVSTKGDGAIVRSLDDQVTKFVSGRVHHFTHLETIEVYTERENVNLAEVLNAMKGSSEKLPDERDNNGLQTYFKKVYPDLDFERVYTSDLKKMVKWFAVLQKNNIDIKLTEPEAQPQKEPVAQKGSRTTKVETEKPEKKVKPKEPVKEESKKAEEKTKTTKVAKEKDQPKKKAAKKAATKETPKKKAAKKK